MSRVPALLFTAVTLLCSACNSPEPKSPDEGLTQPFRPPKMPDEGRMPPTVEVDVYSMYVNDNVRSVCAGPDPYFSFASAKPSDSDGATMKVLAACMMSGPLRGKSILLVGRTDPRGTEEYNDKLGLQRADKVKSYLVAQGVDANRVHTISLGKEDASPMPADWKGDRRVEVRLEP